MESKSVSYRGRLGPFLLKMLDCGHVQGLEWLNREDKLFKMLWIDKRKTGSSSCSEGNPIFKEWEIYNHRHKEGDPEDPSRWKQTFRGALNKSPDVHEQLELSNELRPYRVFQFADGIKVKSSSASLRSNDKIQLNNLRKGKNFHLQGNQSFREVDFEHYKQSNIPKVVTDELHGMGYCVNTFTTMPGQENIDMEMDQHEMKTNPSQIIFPDTESTYRLDSDEFDNIFQRCSSMDFSSFSLPSFNTPENSLEDNNSFVKFCVYYSDNLVLKDEMNNIGVRLFFGQSPQHDYPNVFGPAAFKQIKLPDVRKAENTMNEKDWKLVDLLDRMCRGLLLYCNESGLFALRLCNARVFAWNNLTGLIVLDRKKKTEHKLFDMNMFKAQMNLYKSNPEAHSCPSPTVTLTFGEDYSDKRNIFKKFLVRVELTFVEAERLFQKEISNDLQFSASDSGDMLVKNLNSMNIRE